MEITIKEQQEVARTVDVQFPLIVSNFDGEGRYHYDAWYRVEADGTCYKIVKTERYGAEAVSPQYDFEVEKRELKYFVGQFFGSSYDRRTSREWDAIVQEAMASLRQFPHTPLRENESCP
jgi:hypothetical protein